MKHYILPLSVVLLMGMVSCGGNDNSEKAEDATEVSSAVDMNEAAVDSIAITEVGESTEAEEEVAEAAPSEDWDAVLDEYEKYCTKVVTLAKKAQAGDVTAIGEYASLVETAEKLNKKLDNAKDEMTAAQAARFSKIAAKMASSMM